MKVSELIEALSRFPKDSIVITEGYKNRYDTINEITTINISSNTNNHWWNSDFIKSNDPTLGTNAVYLFFRNRKS